MGVLRRSTKIKLYIRLILVRLALGLILLTVIGTLSYKGLSHEREEKLSPFECGYLPFEERRIPFSSHFFILRLIFLVFDIELVILFPFVSLITWRRTPVSLAILLIFLILLTLGLLVEWEKAMLDWLH